MTARITALVLAAGKSSRMGNKNKLLLKFRKSTIIGQTIQAISESKTAQTIVITGNDAKKIRDNISHDVKFIHNPDFADGLSTSLKAGIKAISDGCDGVMVCLGDMPYLTASDLDRLIENFADDKIIVPVFNDKIGNPLIFANSLFHEFLVLEGDKGARKLLSKYENKIIRVVMDTDAIFKDIDTPEAYKAILSSE